MALQPCNECGAEISAYAKVCPHCGVKKPFESSTQRGIRETGNALLGCGCSIPLLLISLFVLWAIAATLLGC